MATKLKKDDETAPDKSELDLSEIYSADQLNPALSQIYAELGGDASDRVTVYVSKIMEGTGKDARIWNGPPDDYDLMALAKRFGSGDYRVKLYAPTERGNPGMRANQIITILLDPADDARIAAQRRGEVAAQPTQPLLSEQRIAEMITSAMKSNAPAAPVVDPLAMMDRVAGIFAKMIPQPAAAAQVPGNPMKETLGLLRDAISLTNSLRGDDTPKTADGKIDTEGLLMNKGLSVLERILSAKDGGLPAAASADTPANDGLTDDERDQLEELRFALKFAVRAAQSKQEPKEFAESVYEHIPIETIAAFYSDPKWFEMIVANVPAAKDYREFFTVVRASLIAFAQEDKLLTADGRVAETATDGANIEGNATPGATTGGAAVTK